jgi:tetratricopeptide (TPR) repeat protein
MLGFGFNKTKVMASAERYIQQGKLGNAITEYQKILKNDTRDVTVLNTVGDLHARLNQVEEATECFQEVAETYAGTGFTVKAIAVYKKLSKLNPGNLDYVLKLGELYKAQGLLNDARSQYSQAADSKLRSGNTEEGTKLYEKILELDPENLALQTKLADLYLRLSRNPQASDLLLRLAENALRRGVLDGAEHALGRLTTMLPNDPKVLELKGRVALERGNPAQAAEFLENLPALQSTESGLQLLSTVYLQSGRIEKAVPVAKKLLVDFSHPEFLASCCDSLISSHRIAEALQLFTEFSDRLLSPTVIEKLQGCIVALREDPDALESLKKLLENAGDTTHSIEILELVAHASVQKGNLEHARDLYQQLMRLEPQDETHQHNYRQLQTGLETPSATGEEDSPTSAETATSTGDLYPEELEEKIRTALVEAELFENYDKSSGKAVASLEAALADAPFDLRLNQQLALLYARDQRFADAAHCCEKVDQGLSVSGKKEQAREYAEMAAQYRAQADDETAQNEVVEASQQPVEPLAAKDHTPVSPPNPDPSTGRSFDRGPEEIDLSDEWERVSSQPVSEAASIDSDQAGEIVEEIRFYLTELLLREASFAIQHLSEVDPHNPELPGLRKQLAAKDGASTPPAATPAVPVEEIEIEPPTFAAPAPASASGDSTPATGAGAIPSNLGEFVSQLETSLGSDFALTKPPASSTAKPAPATPQVEANATQASPSPADMATPSGAELASPQLQTGPPAAAADDSPSQASADNINPLLSDVFQEFKEEMEAGTATEQDPETHYSLGLAFKEMGLVEEAIGEFQKVCQAIDQGQPFSQTIQAYTWLAHCLVSKGVPEASFKWYQRALLAAPDEEVKTAIYYELGQAYEAAGQKPEALKCFLEVYASNIDHRDVAERIRGLKS